MRSAALLLLACIALSGAPLAAQERSPATTIILVRHAEKDTMKHDPPLTARGRERAQLLARMFAGSGVRSTHSTHFLRTAETVAPLDSALGIANEIWEVDPDSLEAHAAALALHLLERHRGETAVVASHSNVLPLILRALGIATPVEIGEKEYDGVWVITAAKGAQPAMLRFAMGMR
jgi:broad specificity phosphatase PhoE